MNYLNTNIQAVSYKKTLNRKIFVDKSLMIKELNKVINTDDCYVCITRPRRFGKTVNANMLGAYYTKGLNTHPLFDGLKISYEKEYLKHLNQHNVISIDFSRMPDSCRDYEAYIGYIRAKLASDIKEAYGIEKSADMSLADVLLKTSQSFVFILDEWDAVFHEPFMTTKFKIDYLKFLKNLLKDQPYVELAYMTGVLPIAKYSSGSELNMFDEFNFINDNIYDQYFGFNEEEVQKLCCQYPSVSYEEMKWWYDGYYTSSKKSLFNPRSVSKALMRGVCLNYWTETGPMNEIAGYIEQNVDEVKEDIVKLVAGMSIRIKFYEYSAAEQQLNTRDEILSAMVVYGFLSYYKEYVRIPNHELMLKFEQVLSRETFGDVKEIVERSRENHQLFLN